MDTDHLAKSRDEKKKVTEPSHSRRCACVGVSSHERSHTRVQVILVRIFWLGNGPVSVSLMTYFFP